MIDEQGKTIFVVVDCGNKEELEPSTCVGAFYYEADASAAREKYCNKYEDDWEGVHEVFMQEVALNTYLWGEND